MSLKGTLRDGMKNAMKVKDKTANDKSRLDTIRLVLSEIQYEEIQKKIEDLPDPEVVSVIQREIKKRKESLELQEKAGRSSEVDATKGEIIVLESFLPSQLSESELSSIIEGYKASNATLNVGIVMKLLKEQHAGQFDSKLASELAKKVCG